MRGLDDVGSGDFACGKIRSGDDGAVGDERGAEDVVFELGGSDLEALRNVSDEWGSCRLALK